MKRRIIAVGLLVAILASAAFLLCVSRFDVSADEKPASANIVIDNFSFTPKEITVAKGTTVTWVNHDDVPHIDREITARLERGVSTYDLY